jgi:pSer/pThr/pTyr-binding forkhead associated (FHA) protein
MNSAFSETSNQPVARLRMAQEELLLYPGQSIRLGRGNENDLVLDDPKISRMHAQLEWAGSGFVLQDLNSINGTFVNGERLTMPRHLHDGDMIGLNKQELLFEIVRVAPPEKIDDQRASVVTEPLQFRGASLVVAAGPDQGQTFPLWGEQITIGRSSSAATWEIRLSDRSVSRPHARLERRDGSYYLIDLESANGTRLNGQAVTQPERIQDRDLIHVGETQLQFRA